MKAVNLIPQEGRRAGRIGGVGAAGSGTGVYVLLALLAIAVVVTALSAFAGRDLSAKQAELARAESAAQTMEAKAAALGPAKATPGKARMETIEGLIDGRFDWSRSLREVARAVPADVDLTSLVGTVAPSTQIAGGGGGSLRAALPVPAVDLIGCAPSHSRVATVVARLRTIDGVQRVSLASSEKSDAGSLSTTDCRANDKSPQFQLTVFYEAAKGLVPAVDAAVPGAAAAAPPTAAAPPAAAPVGGAQ